MQMTHPVAFIFLHFEKQKKLCSPSESSEKKKKGLYYFRSWTFDRIKIINNTCKKVNTILLIPFLCAKRQSRFNT